MPYKIEAERDKTLSSLRFEIDLKLQRNEHGEPVVSTMLIPQGPGGIIKILSPLGRLREDVMRLLLMPELAKAAAKFNEAMKS
jgi:hypothetical protein